MLHPITPNKYLHFHTAKTEEEYFVRNPSFHPFPTNCLMCMVYIFLVCIIYINVHIYNMYKYIQ